MFPDIWEDIRYKIMFPDNSRKSCEIEMNNVLNAENKSENYCN